MSKLLIKLEEQLLYEFQHIPLENGEQLKYFWDSELEYFLDMAKFQSDEEIIILTIAGISALNIVIQDIKLKRPKAVLMFHDDIDKYMESLISLKNTFEQAIEGKANYKKEK